MIDRKMEKKRKEDEESVVSHKEWILLKCGRILGEEDLLDEKRVIKEGNYRRIKAKVINLKLILTFFTSRKSWKNPAPPFT